MRKIVSGPLAAAVCNSLPSVHMTKLPARDENRAHSNAKSLFDMVPKNMTSQNVGQ